MIFLDKHVRKLLFSNHEQRLSTNLVILVMVFPFHTHYVCHQSKPFLLQSDSLAASLQVLISYMIFVSKFIFTVGGPTEVV